MSANDKFYCAVGSLPMTSFTVQWGVHLWLVSLYSRISANDKFYCGSGVSTYDKFYCAVGCLLMTSFNCTGGCPPVTSFTVQWGVRLWLVSTYSRISAYDKFYCAVGCPPMTSFTVQWGVRLWRGFTVQWNVLLLQVLLCASFSTMNFRNQEHSLLACSRILTIIVWFTW